MKVSAVHVHPLAVYWADYFGGSENVPEHLLRPSANFSGEDMPRKGQFAVLVRIETDEGIIGIGEAWGLPEPRVAAAIIEHQLAPLILGEDPLATQKLWQRMVRSGQNSFLRAFLMEAVSGIDIALWDIKGKYMDMPIHRVLGGPVRQRIDTYASPVPFLPPGEAGQRAGEFVDKGFHALKVKVGGEYSADVDRVAAVREVVGGQVQVVVDANCALNVPEAIQLGRAMSNYGVAWLEEPLPTADRAGLAEVRQALDMAVVAGENEHTTHGVLDLLERRAVDAIQINITRCGGITGAVQIAELCRPFGIPVAPHGVGSAIGMAATLQYLAAVPNFMIYEYNQLLNPLRDDLLVAPIEFEDGYLHVPTGAGLGIELISDWDERYALPVQPKAV